MKKKKILIFECWSHTPQFETGLEIAEIHANRGDNVTYVNIGGYLPFVEWHLSMDASNIRRFIYRYLFKVKMNRTKKVIDPSIEFYDNTLLTNSDINNVYEDIIFEDIEELKSYEWRDIDIGMATASSLISITNHLLPDIKNEYRSGVKNILHASKIAALSFEKWLDKVNPDLVYFRNGRVALYRPVMRICQQREQAYLIHDRGCNKDHYKISPDLRHNFGMVNKEVIKAWDNEKNNEKKEQIAADFYSHRRQGKEQAWKAFLDKQEKDILPSNWDENQYNITFFNSSISEYAAIGKINKTKPLFKNQIDAINFIANVAKENEMMRFYLRLHPNLLNQSQAEIDLWMGLTENPLVNVIPADSKIDTYAMMLNSDLNIAFLSTTAIESAYYNKPTIQLASSMYESLNSTYFPKTKEEFKRLLLNRNLKPKDNLGARKYGYYMNTFGTEYIHFCPTSFQYGKFKGVDLQEESKTIKVLKRLKNLI